MGNLFNDYFGIDHGFGGIKFAYYDNNGKMIKDKFPSVVAYSDVEIQGAPKFLDKWWYIGEDAIMQPSDKIIEISDYATLKRMAPLMEYAAIVKAGKLQSLNKMKIVAGLSVAHGYEAEQFRQALSSFNINGIEYKANVSFQEQGRGAFFTLEQVLNKLKTEKPKHYMIVDIGFNTMDIVFVSNNTIINIKAHEKQGFIQLADVMRSRINAEHNRTISLKEAAAIIDSGFYYLRGEKFSKEKLISKMKSEYTAGLMMFLEKHYGEYIDKMPKIFFVGGGAYVIDEKYSKNIKVVEDAEYYNVIGNLLKAKTL